MSLPAGPDHGSTGAMTPILLILRGVPGSGKSTYLQSFQSDIVTSIDKLLEVNGVYCWSPGRLKEAIRRHEEDLAYRMNSRQDVIVDNCNSRLSDFSWLVRIAQGFGYDICITTFVVPVGREDEVFKRNTHGVPRKTWDDMLKRLRTPLPAEFGRYEVELPVSLGECHDS